ncbi:hypothetical protein WR25_08399 [Diploscapter pachys]|uniref:DUF1311 domain-containing protein n=1 Tax=Diploscapter pachys TaxID=2018661 RepID=A0A2A2KJJ1_9BILA|nr:hypothetical protein WR25_08399 [Diploscapter pachys]
MQRIRDQYADESDKAAALSGKLEAAEKLWTQLRDADCKVETWAEKPGSKAFEAAASASNDLLPATGRQAAPGEFLRRALAPEVRPQLLAIDAQRLVTRRHQLHRPLANTVGQAFEVFHVAAQAAHLTPLAVLPGEDEQLRCIGVPGDHQHLVVPVAIQVDCPQVAALATALALRKRGVGQ